MTGELDHLMEPAPEPPTKTLKSTKDFKPKKESARYDKESDTYNHKPKDPEYFKNYWRNHNCFIECDACGLHTSKLALARHKKSNKCKRLASLRETQIS